MAEDGPVDAFCGWFDVSFAGSEQHPADSTVMLTTAPDATGSTHWGQQVFYVHPGIGCVSGDELKCSVKVARREDNHRLLNVDLKVKVESQTGSSSSYQLNYNMD